MLFPTYSFLFFFLLVFGVAIFLKPFVSVYKGFLLVVSLIFYGFWSVGFLGLLVLDIVVNYGLLVWLVREPLRRQKMVLWVGVFVNLVYLGVFKYFNFFASGLWSLLNYLHLPNDFQTLQIIAPVGISFYTFRILSQLIDGYRACQSMTTANILPSFIDYSVYVSYFPQIASGPIARGGDFYQQLNSRQKYDYKISEVIILIISGLGKKYTLSSFLFNFSQLPFRSPQQYSSLDLILATFAYTGLIYVDFSGYSDLSNGISALLGFKPVVNFNQPYRALSLQEFWRRWHISLSEWLRDYLYIPLGGNRQGKIRHYFNLFLTMLVGGFWHGTGANFIIWGGLHGLGLVVNHLGKNITKSLLFWGRFRRITGFLSWLCTFSFISLAWIFFNSVDLATTQQFFRAIFASPVKIHQLNCWQIYLIFAIILIMNFYGDKISLIFRKILDLSHVIIQVILVSISLYIIFMLGPSTVAQFIYFNF